MIRFDSTARPSSAIGIAPLIDVVFLLLIFFMLATSFAIDQSIDLGLPGERETAGTAAAPGAGAERLLVEIRGDGRLLLNGLVLGVDRLGDELRGRLAGRPGAPVTVRAEQAVPVQTLVTVIDAVRGAGVIDIDLVAGMAAPATGADR